jgi:diguanylate cyclase (GGDEF)-like protein
VLTRYQKRVETLASFDKLTDLLNRQAFDVLLSKLMPDIRRRGTPAMLILADLDHFKQINDQYGHQIGDSLLQAVAALLQERLRESDLAVRWGGEEFLLVLRDCASEEVPQVVDDLRRAVAGVKVNANGVAVSVTMSLGVTTLSGSETIDQAVFRADAALYRAKAAGRNQVVYEPGSMVQTPKPASEVSPSPSQLTQNGDANG